MSSAYKFFVTLNKKIKLILFIMSRGNLVLAVKRVFKFGFNIGFIAKSSLLDVK